MARKNQHVARRTNASQEANESVPATTLGGELAVQVRQLFEEGQHDAAFDLLVRDKITSAWMTNALAVCHLRRGSPKLAVELLRGLVLASGGIVLRRDVPAVYKTNYAAALLASDNLQGCLSVLGEMNDADHSAVTRLKGAIRSWREGLSLWQRIALAFGSEPASGPTVDFPLGDLE